MLKCIFKIKSRSGTYLCSALNQNKPNHKRKPNIFDLLYFTELKLKPQRPVQEIMVLHHDRISAVPDVAALTLAASIH